MEDAGLPVFAFRSAGEIRFGRGTAAGVAAAARGYGTGVILCHGATAARADWLAGDLAAAGCTVRRLSCAGEPDLPGLLAALAEARDGGGADVVVALGGGSVVDFGKALAGLLPAPGDPLDHLEVVGRGLPLGTPPLPMIAVPTTAGTGSEVTRNAVIGVPEARRKVSLRDAGLIPDLAVVDPALTDGTPLPVTLASGLDAVTQVIEPFLCSRANPMTDALCQAAIPRGLDALRRLVEAEEAAARDDMAWVSLCGGLALANAGLGAVHGLAGVLGGMTSAPHGAICGALLPHVLAANRAALPPEDGALRERFDWVVGEIGAALGAKPEHALDRLASWSEAHGLPRLGAMGLRAAEIETAAAASASSSSMKANPVGLSTEALSAILRAAL